MSRLRAFVVCCCVSGSVWGAGFQLYTEGSSEALGQAGAVVARSNLVSQAWYNPAGLAGAQRAEVMSGAAFVRVETVFDSASAPDSSMADDWRTIPHFYYILPLNEDWTGMLSINAPYGLITQWPKNWAGADLAIYSKFRAIYLTPSVAWRATDRLSVSVGANMVVAHARLTRTGSRLDGDDTAPGGTASVRFQALDNWALGARYQSKIDLKLTGDINDALDATAGITLPSTATVGLANTSIKNLTLELDVVWTEWSVYDELKVKTASGTQAAPKDWNDVWSIRAGGEYALSADWALRAGYVWDESPIPGATRSPELPGSDRQMLTGGIGWSNGRIGIDAAYTYLWAKTVDMGSIYPLEGTFKTTSHVVSLSASYAF